MTLNGFKYRHFRKRKSVRLEISSIEKSEVRTSISIPGSNFGSHLGLPGSSSSGGKNGSVRGAKVFGWENEQ